MATDKFKALVHHVVSSCDNPNKLGAIRLNKILWFADTLSYRAHGVPMTGEHYVKRKFGPVPKTILRTLGELEEENKIVIRDKETPFGTNMRHFINLTEPDDSVFSPDELNLIHGLLVEICDNHTANSISDLTHDQVWEAAEFGEEIPLAATLAGTSGELTKEVLDWATDVVESREAA